MIYGRRLLTLLAASGLCLASLGGTLAHAMDEAPDVSIRRQSAEVLGSLKADPGVKAGNGARIIALVDSKIMPNVNFKRMTASAVGVVWRQASPEQQQRLQQEFKTLLVRTYASALASYSSQKFDFRPLRSKPTDTDVTVNVRILQSGSQPVTIDYDMEKRPGGWKVWDVRVGGISLVANYRTEFDNQVREAGIEGLIKTLVTKNRSLERGPTVAAPAEKK